MSAPVVLIAEQLSPATIAALGPDFEVVHVDGTDREALRSALRSADAILVRSATQLDAEAIGWAPRLKVIARAGVGLDNVDIKAATQAGVMVVNAPTSNIISAAELTVAHILGLARHLPRAHASLSAGAWKRSAFTGIELYEKTVGIIGLGRIGALVAERLRGFGVELVAYDPYVTAARAQQLGVQLVSLEELVERADFLTIHMPRTPETLGMIGEAQLKAMKSSAYVVNVARGGLIDEAALAAALAAGEIAGAALDVFVQEPPADTALTGLDRVNVTPHLGASTEEAQEKAGVAVAKSVRLALAGDLVPDAVNVAGGVIDEYVRPGLPLTEKLGQVFAGLADGAIASLDIEVHGELAEHKVEALRLGALKGIFSKVVSDPVSYVNAPLLAEQRNVEVRFTVDTVSESYRNVITIRGALTDGTTLSVSGTLTGPKQVEKIVEINGYEVELPIPEHLVVFSYTDRPGIVATYGGVLGEAGVNIAGLQIARDEKLGKALSVLSVDAPVEESLIGLLRGAIGADAIHMIDIDTV
ncbi:phosphoglycerate dehydrogenase [Leucobacter allii]|uniref:D-3-phosphoglycerate dehydrogenase n=1 Tax=Leucobacter allii TaxID=2932247 RepID=A0ABY4FPT2_9MICO|nr:phosphoglycerate dehydrogenase [Leucobacter allii]UOQ58209.1 phosphoglycerate dehydrogenase [Leucobacter allii]UOR02791.1 phosphoglycerate dehydrogenase [Leucobacter allii]